MPGVVEQVTSGKEKAVNGAVCVYEQAYHQQAPGETLRPGGLALTRHALDACELPPGARLLDVGCGSGVTVQYLRERGYSASGVDLSALLLQAGRQRAATLPLFQADAAALPLASGDLAALIAECSLSVFAETARILEEFHRLLRPDGILILSDLYVRDPAGLASLRSILPDSCLARAFIRKELLDLLAERGFDLLTWEDHSEIIKAFAGQSVSTMLQGTPANGMDALDVALAIARVKPGYFLGILRKRSSKRNQ